MPGVAITEGDDVVTEFEDYDDELEQREAAEKARWEDEVESIPDHLDDEGVDPKKLAKVELRPLKIPESDTDTKFTGLSAHEDWGGPVRGGDTDATFLTDDPERTNPDPHEAIESPPKTMSIAEGSVPVR